PHSSRHRPPPPRPPTLPLHDALPIFECRSRATLFQRSVRTWEELPDGRGGKFRRELGNADWKRTTDSKNYLAINLTSSPQTDTLDRKSTRLNSSHEWISYAVFCLKKK